MEWQQDLIKKLINSQDIQALNEVTQICQQYLEEEFGPDMASYLTNGLYWKQVEYTDKKGKIKKKKEYFHYFAQREMTKLILLIIWMNIAGLK